MKLHIYHLVLTDDGCPYDYGFFLNEEDLDKEVKRLKEMNNIPENSNTNEGDPGANVYIDVYTDSMRVSVDMKTGLLVKDKER